MKHLQSFRLFEARASGLTPDQEVFLNRYTRGTWSVNPETGLVDVSGDFDCSKKGFKSLRGVSFGHVSGNFLCGANQLTTLVGAPRTVGGAFSCANSLQWGPSAFKNQLTSLDGAPLTVNGGFYCDYNQLKTLDGAPQTVGGDFSCAHSQLKTLDGAPRTVGGNFLCAHNLLTSLAGSPETVGGNFYCRFNPLTSLEGAPQTIDGIFHCDAFRLEQGEWNFSGWDWNFSGWEKILTTGNAAAQKLMKTLPWTQPDWWNSELQRDPGKTVHLLASCWKHMPEDLKSGIVIPPGYENEFGLFSDFDDLGLF